MKFVGSVTEIELDPVEETLDMCRDVNTVTVVCALADFGAVSVDFVMVDSTGLVLLALVLVVTTGPTSVGIPGLEPDG